MKYKIIEMHKEKTSCEKRLFVKLCFSLHFKPLDPHSESESTDTNESGSTSLILFSLYYIISLTG